MISFDKQDLKAITLMSTVTDDYLFDLEQKELMLSRNRITDRLTVIRNTRERIKSIRERIKKEAKTEDKC